MATLEMTEEEFDALVKALDLAIYGMSEDDEDTDHLCAIWSRLTGIPAGTQQAAHDVVRAKVGPGPVDALEDMKQDLIEAGWAEREPMAKWLRGQKAGWFSERETMEQVLDYINGAMSDDYRTAAITGMMMAVNTLLENLACAIEGEDGEPVPFHATANVERKAAASAGVDMGAAGILIKKQGGTIRVYHGDDGDLLAELEHPPEGSWSKIWQALDKLGFDRRYVS